MRKPDLKVSAAWIENVFNTPPRRDVKLANKSTTRFDVRVPSQRCIFHAEGGNEHIALLIARHLQSIGIVKRFKAQPFSLDEIGGPRGRIPDLLVELITGDLDVVQCKSHRFITPEVMATFDQERSCLNDLGFGFHVWTNRDKVGQPISSNMRDHDRAFNHPPDPVVVEQVRARVSTGSTLQDLLRDFSRDDVIGAAALCSVHFDIRRQINENTIASLHPPEDYADYFFARRDVSKRWWGSLENRQEG